MDTDNLPMPDSTIRHFLVLMFGSGAVIVVIYNVFNFLLAWLGPMPRR